MKLARIAVDRPVTTFMLYIAVALFGFISLSRLSVDLLPDINFPRFSIVTEYPGVAPEGIETLITAPLERAVSRVPGIRRVESISREGVSHLILEFNWGTNMDFATLHAREKLDEVRYLLPEEAENPAIFALDPRSRPVMLIAISGPDSLVELKRFSEELVKPRLEQVEGIGTAEVIGGEEREILVEVKPELLSLYGLTINGVARQIEASNRNLQGGNIRKGRFKHALRIIGEFESPDEIGEIGLKTTVAKGVLRLRDVARIKDTIRDRQGAFRLNGKECIAVLVHKESGANTVGVIKKTDRLLGELREEYPAIGVSVVTEQARYIRKAITSVNEEVVSGGFLAFIILLIFLQELRASLTIFMVIAISVIATFNLLFLGDVTLNIMSLGGLALGVGMLDDCAIVISENILRHRKSGKSSPEAASVGTKEVALAASATVFTTIVVFLPVIYVHGVAGRLFRDQALTVTFSLLASLFVSLTLVPMLSSRHREGKALIHQPFFCFVFKKFNMFYANFNRRYHIFLMWSLDHKAKILWVSSGFFLLTFLLAGVLPRELMPNLRVSSFEANLKTPVEFSFAQTADLVVSLERWLAKNSSVKACFSEVGVVSAKKDLALDIALNSARITVVVRSPSELEPTVRQLRQTLTCIPGLRFSIIEEHTAIGQFLAFETAELGLKIKGDNLETLERLAATLSEKLKTIRGITDITSSLEEGKPEYLIKVRKDRLGKFELSPEIIGTAIIEAAQGRTATQLRELDRKYDVIVRLEAQSRGTIESLLDQKITYREGVIPLRELVDYEVGLGPKEIRRENGQREVLVSASLGGVKISRIVPLVREKIQELGLPPNYRVEFGGELEEMVRSFRSLIRAFVLSAVLVYMVMAAQFESLLHPFLIIFTIPMGLSGAFLFLFLTGQTLNVFSIIGIIVLIGIVTDNAIVKVDYTNQLRRAGLPLREAVLEGSLVRLRPILMTSMTTIFGLVPLALGLGEGGELERPLGIAVIGGLIFSTFLTLVLIPVFYEFVESRRETQRR